MLNIKKRQIKIITTYRKSLRNLASYSANIIDIYAKETKESIKGNTKYLQSHILLMHKTLKRKEKVSTLHLKLRKVHILS